MSFIRKVGLAIAGIAVLKAGKVPIGGGVYRDGDPRLWIRTSTYGYSLAATSEYKAV